MSKEVNPHVRISPKLQEAAQQHRGDIKGPLLKELELAYSEITGKVLTIGCASCISTGLKIIVNYVNLYPQSDQQKKNTKIKVVDTTEVETLDDRPDNMLKLRELRVRYPHIKAVSVKAFLTQLDEKYNDTPNVEEWRSK